MTHAIQAVVLAASDTGGAAPSHADLAAGMALVVGLMGRDDLATIGGDSLKAEIGCDNEVVAACFVADAGSFGVHDDCLGTIAATLTVVYADSSCVRIPVVVTGDVQDDGLVAAFAIDVRMPTERNPLSAAHDLLDRASHVPGRGDRLATVAALQAERNIETAARAITEARAVVVRAMPALRRLSRAA